MFQSWTSTRFPSDNGFKCAKADNTCRCDPQDVKDWLRRNFIASLKKRGPVRTDVHQYMENQIHPAVAFFESLNADRAPPDSRSCLLPEARRIEVQPRRLLTRTFGKIVTFFRLDGINAQVMPKSRANYLEIVGLTNLPPAYEEKRPGNQLSPPNGHSSDRETSSSQGPAPSSGSSGATSSSQSLGSSSSSAPPKQPPRA